MTLLGTGNVGIGTTGPGATLDVYSATSGVYPQILNANQPVTVYKVSGSVVGYIGAPANYFQTGGIGNGLLIRSENIGIQFAPGGSGSGIAVTMLPSGNVGIGTSTPGSLLHVYKSSATQPFVTFEDPSAASNPALSIKNDTTAWFLETVGARSNNFEISKGGGAASNSYLVVTTGGNVGIGTTGPLQVLDVVGNIAIGRSQDNISRYIGKTATGGAIPGNTSWIGFTSTTLNDYIAFGTHHGGVSSGERMRIDQDGNVGIGTTGPNSKLDVQATAGTSIGIARFLTPSMSNGQQNYIVLGQGLAGSDGFTLVYNHNTAAASRYLAIQPDENNPGSTSLVLNANGNVGIGTTGPVAKLDILDGNIRVTATAVGTWLNLRQGNSDTVPFISSVNNASESSATAGWGFFDRSTEGNFQIQYKQGSTSWNNAVTILRSNGNVGIGTTNPSSAKLQVSGNAMIVGQTSIGTGVAPQTYATMYNQQSYTNIGSDIYGEYVNTTQKETSNSSNTLYGIYSYTQTSSDTSVNLTSGLYGYYSYAIHGGTGTLSSLYGYSAALRNGSTGTITNAYGFYENATNANAAGTIGTLYGVYLAAPSNSGTINNKYALVTEANAGNVGIGITAPGTKLQVVGVPVNMSSATHLGVYGTADLFDTTVPTGSSVGNGGILTLSGYYDGGSARAAFAAIGGIKDTTSTAQANGALVLYTSPSGSALAERMRISNGGNVGIGTSSPGYKLDVNGNLQVNQTLLTPASTNLNILPATGVTYFNTSSLNNNLYIYGYDVDSNTYTTINGHNLQLQRSGTVKVLFTDSGNNYIMSGNVGIGTTGPTLALDVRSANGTIVNSLGQIGAFTTDSQAIDKGGMITFGGVYTGTSIATFAEIAGKKENGTDANYSGYLAFATVANGGSDSEKMRITSAGNVGIGTTAPQRIVDIGAATPRIRFYNLSANTQTNYLLGSLEASNAYTNSTSYSAASIDFLSDNPGWYYGDIVFKTNGSDSTASLATERMRIKYGGNVGIGTTGPVAKLDIQNTTIGTNIYAVNSRTSGTNYGTDTEAVGSGATSNIAGYFAALGATNNYAIQIAAGYPGAGANNYAIKSDSAAQSYFAGNVGIGTTSPSTDKLGMFDRPQRKPGAGLTGFFICI